MTNLFLGLNSMRKKAKNQTLVFNMRTNERVQNALETLADFYGLSSSAYLRMTILKEFKAMDVAKA